MSSQLRSENIVISSYRTRSRGAPLRNSRVWQERARVHGCNSPHRGERWTTRRGERAESAGTALRPRERRLVYKGNSYESMINRPCLPLVFACLYIYIYIYRAVGRTILFPTIHGTMFERFGEWKKARENETRRKSNWKESVVRTVERERESGFRLALGGGGNKFERGIGRWKVRRRSVFKRFPVRGCFGGKRGQEGRAVATQSD